MRFRYLCLIVLAGALLISAPPRSQAQISIQIGPAPVCPYGYYGFAPYGCAPYGYYGPAWFSDGIFIGAGPWFHGPRYFHGYVNRYYDPRYGYHGYFPHRGDRPDWDHHRDFEHEFRGTHEFDEHGHAYGHYKDHGDHGEHGHDHDR